QDPRPPPATPICRGGAATGLVGGHSPSLLPGGGWGVPPPRFPVALKALPEPWRLGRFEARFRRSLARKPSP
ncbi:rep protein, partial [Escherichia coli]